MHLYNSIRSYFYFGHSWVNLRLNTILSYKRLQKQSHRHHQYCMVTQMLLELSLKRRVALGFLVLLEFDCRILLPPFQIIRRFVFSGYIVFVMNLNVYTMVIYIINQGI